MARRHLQSHLSGEQQSLAVVWDAYEFQSDLIGEEKARVLDAFSSGASPNNPRYFGQTRDQIIQLFDGQGDEIKNAAMLNLMTATEAALRVDYLVRVMKKRKDAVSRGFTELYKEHQRRVSLEEHILEIWKEHSAEPGTKRAIGEFRGVLNLRHWLAHGRYWRRRFGQDYDPQDVLHICDALLKATIAR